MGNDPDYEATQKQRREKRRATKIKIAKDLEMVRVPLSLMHHLRDHLDFMNTSAAHAASKVVPVSHSTSYLIDVIDAALAKP